MSSQASVRWRHVATWLLVIAAAGLFWREASFLIGLHTPLNGVFQDLTGRVRNIEALRRTGNIYRSFQSEAFTYPPGAIGFFRPLQWTTKAARDFYWTVASLLALMTSLAIVFRRATSWPLSTSWLVGGVVAIITAVGCNPVLECLQWGQTGLLLQLLIVVDVLVVPTRYRGVLLGPAIAIKLFPALFLVAFALRREWRTVKMAIASAALITATSACLWPTSAWYFVRTIVLGGNEFSHFNTPSNLVNDTSIAAFLNRGPFFNGTEPQLARYAICLALALGGLFVAHRAWRAGYDVTSLCVLLITDAAALPNAWIHYDVFVPLLFAATLELRPRRVSIAIVLLTLGLCVPWVYFRKISGVSVWHMAELRVIYDADAALALSIVLAVGLFLPAPARGARRRRNARSPALHLR